jgi:bacteriocin-like protein
MKKLSKKQLKAVKGGEGDRQIRVGSGGSLYIEQSAV